jgi:ceramide glucosyltransferase
MIGEVALGSTYFLLYLGATAFSLFQARRAVLHAAAAGTSGLPPSWAPVTHVTPVRGWDRFSEACARSWLGQEYEGPIQHVYSLQDAKDPALPHLERLKREYAAHGARIDIICRPVSPGHTGKTSNLANAIPLAEHEILVMSDADIRAPRDALARLVRLLDGGSEIVSCLPKHAYASNLWGRLYANAWNIAMLHIWAPSVLREAPVALAGGTIALRKATLERLGGIAAYKDFIAEDLALGRAAAARGMAVALGPDVSSPVGNLRFRDLLSKYQRAGVVLARMSPGGLGTAAALNALLYAYLPLLAYAVCRGFWGSAAGLAGIAFLRMAMVGLTGEMAGGKPRLAWEVPLQDALIVATFIGAVVRPRVEWGGIRYAVERGGRVRALR